MAKYGCIILKGESIIKDEDSGSKSLFPIEVEKDHQVKLYRTDIQEQVEARSKACDYLMVCDEDQYKISCLTELKGTQKPGEVRDALKQIEASLLKLREDYLRGSKIATGIIVGASDKTLPKMISSDARSVCRKLYSQCIDKKRIKNMDNLLIYFQPEKSIRKAAIFGKDSNKTIKCHSRAGAYVPVPSMIIEIATKSS